MIHLFPVYARLHEHTHISLLLHPLSYLKTLARNQDCKVFYITGFF